MESVAQRTEGFRCTPTAGKHLTFNLAQEFYGIEILAVQEIIGMMNVTHIPRSPDFIRGVINLRGKVIPVIDLRTKFGLRPKEDTERTCIIVVQISRNRHPVTMGLIVDEVSEVVDIAAEQIEPAPEFGERIDNTFLLGLGKVGLKVVMLLDAEKILSIGDLLLVKQPLQGQ